MRCFVFLILLLASCSVRSEQEVAMYRRELDIETDNPYTGGALSLASALQLANQNNETLSMRGEEYLRSVLTRRITAASFLPTVQLVPTYVLRDEIPQGASLSDNDVNNNVRSSNEQGKVSFDLRGELSFTVFNGMRDVHRYWADTYRIEQQRNELWNFQEEFLLEVARAYYQVLQARQSIQVLEASLASQQERLRSVTGRRDAGLARALDVTQTEAQAASTRTDLINAERDAENAALHLALLLGLLFDDQLTLSDSYEVPTELPHLAEYVAAANESHPELRAAQASVEAASHSIEEAFGQYYPEISVDVTAFLSRETAPTEREWDGIIAARIPIFEAGRIDAEVREATSFFRQAKLLQSYSTKRVERDIRQGYNSMQASIERRAQLELQENAARLAFNQSEASYRVGLATNLDQIVAQEALLAAELEHARERFNLKVSYLALLQASGLLRHEVAQLNSNDSKQKE